LSHDKKLCSHRLQVLTPALRSTIDAMPSGPKDLVIQYSTESWVTGIANSKLFCFLTLADAQEYKSMIEKRDWALAGNLTFDIWEAQAVNVTKKTMAIRVNKNFSMDRFYRFWDNLLPWNFKGVMSVFRNKSAYLTKMVVADKMILVKRVEN
jgi:hypothetical protein